MQTILRNRLLSNFSWLMGEKGFNAALSFGVSIYVIRYLGPENLGLLSYAQSLVFLFGTLSTLGLNGIVVRELVRNEKLRDVILGSSLLLRSVASFAAAILVVAYTLFVPGEPAADPIVWALCFGMIFNSFSVVDQYFESKISAKSVIRFRTMSFLISILIRVTLVFCKADIVFFAWAISLSNLIGAVGYLWSYRQSGLSIWNWSFERGLATRMLRDGWPFLLAGLAIHIQARIDQVMLASMVGAESVGNYSLALRLIELTALVTTALASTFGPLVTTAHSQGPAAFAERLTQFYRLQIATGLILGILVFSLGNTAVSLVYGDSFVSAGSLFSLFSFRLLLTHMGMARASFILNKNLQLYSSVVMVAGTFINVAGNLLLIPKFQEFGAYYASLISFSSMFLFDALHPEARMNLRVLARAAGSFWKINSRTTGQS